MFCASAFAGIAEALAQQSAVKRLKAYVVRSVTVEPILPYLTTEAVLSNYVLDIQVGGYGSYVDEMLNPQSALANSSLTLSAFCVDLEDLAGRLPELCADGIGEGVRGGDRRVCITRGATAQEFSLRQLRPEFSSRMCSP